MTKRYPFEPNYRVHPGATLREIAVWRLAEQIGIFPEALAAIADKIDPMTQEIADALATIDDGPDASFWMNLQRNYDNDGARIDASATTTDSSERRTT